MTYAIYLRKSRKDDDAGFADTLSRHEKMLMDYADRMGLVVHEQDIYREVVSGESIEARPQMQRLLKAVEMRTYTAVLCIELERLSRGNGADQARILKAFQFSNTKIITLNKTYDLASDDEFDEEFFEFGLFMSRREYKTIKRRLLRGRLQSQQEGYFTAPTTPFGYGKIKNPEGKGYILVPNEQTPILQMIFRRYANGDSLADIVHDLNTAGVKTASSVNARWTTNRVRDMLRNRVYIGEINVKKYAKNRRMEDGRIIETKRRNPDMQTVPGKHEPIIDMETWKKVQARFARFEPRTNIDRTLKNPLASIMRCAECGKMMARRTYTHKGVSIPIIVCQSNRCITRQSNLEMVENMVIEALKKELARQQTILASYSAEKQDSADDETLSFLQAEIAKKDKMMERVDELYELGDYSRTKYLERSQKLQAQKAELMKQLEEVEKRISERDSNRKNAVPILAKVLDEYHTLDVKGKNDLLKMIVDCITYRKHESGSDIEPELDFRLLI